MMGKKLYDTDIREPLFDFLEEMYGKVRVIEEKMMGKSRADIIAVTDGTIIGIEIKSDADTYARLSRQVKDYDLFFDKNYVVVGKSHSMHKIRKRSKCSVVGKLSKQKYSQSLCNRIK